MATTTSTRGKTKPKTTKSSAKAKTTKTTKAAVSTKAKTAKVTKAVKTSAAVKTSVSNTGRLLGLSVLLYAGLAVAVGLLMNQTSYPVTVTHQTGDALLSQGGTSFITASKPLFDVELRWALVTLLAVSAVLPVLYLTKLKNYYAERLAKGRVLTARWFDLGVSSALMVVMVGMLVGIHDIMFLKLMSGFMTATCALGWLAERQNENATKPVWSAFNISLFTGLMPWFAIAVTKVGTMFYGSVRSPWYVYASCAALIIGFSLLAHTQLVEHRRSITDYTTIELKYQVVSLLTRVSFVAILLIGLVK